MNRGNRVEFHISRFDLKLKLPVLATNLDAKKKQTEEPRKTLPERIFSHHHGFFFFQTGRTPESPVTHRVRRKSGQNALSLA